MKEQSDPLPLSAEDAVETQFAEQAVRHLADWDNATQTPIVDEEQFTNDEHDLITIEKARTFLMEDIDNDQYIGNQVVDFSEKEKVLTKWGELIDEIMLHKGVTPCFNILVTGLPISGKATTRRALCKGLQKHSVKTSGIDRDYIKQPMNYLINDGVNIVEDMHGIDQESPNINDLEQYDMVIYTEPGEADHIKMIQSRGDVWRDSEEKVDLTDGTGTALDSRWTRLFQSMRSESKAQQSREKWLEVDEVVLKKLSSKIPVIKLNPVGIIASSYQSS